MVKIKVPVVVEEKESKKKFFPPLFIIGLVLFSSIIGVYYFHGDYSPPDVSDEYNEDWYRRNSQATIPQDLIDLLKNISDALGESNLVQNNPELNLPQDVFSSIFPNKTVFFVRGKVDPLAWKVASLSRYVPYSGWRFRELDPIEYHYVPRGISYDYSYIVIKPYVIVNTTTELFIPTLQSGYEEISFHDLEVSEVHYPVPLPPNLDVEFKQSVDLNSGGGIVRLESNMGVNISFQYIVDGISLNETEISYFSGTINEVRNIALGDDYLSRFIGLPKDYMENHPRVKDLADYLYLGPDTKVYEQVKEVVSYLSIRFRLSNETAPPEEDPVAWFVDNLSGSPIYFIYTVALILRYYGIPVRIAVGYIIGDYNSELDLTEFTMSRHLFLWLEVYDSGLGYWVNYNAIPYIFTDITGIPLPENMIDPTIAPIVTIIAPRYYYGVPAVYFNESFSVVCSIFGLRDSELVGSMIIYDLNISSTEPIAITPFVETNSGLISIFVSSFELIYQSFPEEEPVYGIHILKIIVGSTVILKPIALLKRVSITP